MVGDAAVHVANARNLLSDPLAGGQRTKSEMTENAVECAVCKADPRPSRALIAQNAWSRNSRARFRARRLYIRLRFPSSVVRGSGRVRARGQVQGRWSRSMGVRGRFVSIGAFREVFDLGRRWLLLHRRKSRPPKRGISRRIGFWLCAEVWSTSFASRLAVRYLGGAWLAGGSSG